MQKILEAIMKIIDAIATYLPVFVQACLRMTVGPTLYAFVITPRHSYYCPTCCFSEFQISDMKHQIFPALYKIQNRK
jgi:hypothetical protein